MQKPTVEQKYMEQQKMNKQENKQDKGALSSLNSNQNVQKVFRQMQEALLQAQQAVRQAMLANPIQAQLQLAEQRLQYATMQLQQLKTFAPEYSLGVPKGTQQQLTQLDHQIEQAGQTLKLIKQSTSTSP